MKNTAETSAAGYRGCGHGTSETIRGGHLHFETTGVRPAECGKTGSLMRFRKAYRLYLTVLFIVLIPIVLYGVFARGAPKLTLVFIPICVVLAAGFYEMFKRS